MPQFKPRHSGTRRALHGATRREHGRGRYSAFDRWLDRMVAVAVSTALLVGTTALILMLL